MLGSNKYSWSNLVDFITGDDNLTYKGVTLTRQRRPVRTIAQQIPGNVPVEIEEPDFTKLIEDTVAYLDTRFENLDKKPLSCFEIFDISKLPYDREDVAIYGDKEVDDLIGHFSDVLTEEEIREIPNQWPDFKIWMAGHRGRSHLLDLYSDLVKENPQHLQHILVLVQLLLTLSPSTASCERGFSCMNRVKNSQRTCLHNDILNDLMQLSANGCEVDEYSPDKAVEHWFFSGKGTRHLSHKTPQRSRNGRSMDEETDLSENSEEIPVHVDSSSEGASSDTVLE